MLLGTAGAHIISVNLAISMLLTKKSGLQSRNVLAIKTALMMVMKNLPEVVRFV